MKNIYMWLEEACRPIRYGPDRDAAYRELKDHFQDHCEYIEAQGVLHDVAEKQALEAMGDPAETGRMLAAAYHPALTLLWRISRVLLICLVIAVVIAGAVRIYKGRPQELPLGKDPEEEILNSMSFYREKDPDVRMIEGRSYHKAALGEYSFTITKALKCQWQISDDPEDIYHFIVLVLKAKGPVELDMPLDIRSYVSAEDDKGNVYYNILDKTSEQQHSSRLTMNAYFKQWSNSYYLVDIGDTEPGLQWIDLIYDHLGQHFSLRVMFDQETVK